MCYNVHVRKGKENPKHQKGKKMSRKELIEKATILKVEICKKNGGNTNYKNWLHFMNKQSSAELKRIIENIESHLSRIA